MTVSMWIFWLSLLVIFHAYVGYPLSLAFLAFFRRRSVKKGDATPPISFIITAYNEEKSIRRKLENTLAQDYPEDKMEIIVASDCSGDSTDSIVKEFVPKGVLLVRTTNRGGKENAQGLALSKASGELIVFSDVGTTLDKSGVSSIVSNFNDPSVGCVSSVDRVIGKTGEISGEGAYVRYEMFLRQLESDVNSLVGLSGSFFAARREVCYPWAIDMQSDFNTLLNSVQRGYRGVCDEGSIGYYDDLADKSKEFSRKVRTVSRGINVFFKGLQALNIFKYGLFSFQLFSHKLCRWIVPFALLSAFASNAMLVGHGMIYPYLFIGQLIFYITAIIGYKTKANSKLFTFASFFVMVNISILLAWLKYANGEYYVKWEPSER